MTTSSRMRLTAAVLITAALAVACSAPVRMRHAGATTSAPGAVTPRATGTASGPADPPATAAKAGELLTRNIPGGSTHFTPRPALIYLPPVALRDKHVRLPVLEMFHGTPGAPASLTDPRRGQLLSTAQAFARDHDGRAPIIVMPDVNGSLMADSECVRTRSGADVESYLADVVPAWITAHLPATRNHRDWAIGGISEGGTCSLMLALRHPGVWATIGDFSGLAELSVSEYDDPAPTVRELFDGSVADYDAHDPLHLIAKASTLRGTRMWLQCGGKDKHVLPDQTRIAAAARAKGALVHAVVTPGIAHNWRVWAPGFRLFLPWFWQATNR